MSFFNSISTEILNQNIKIIDKLCGFNIQMLFSYIGHIYIMTNIPDTEFLQPATLVVRATQYDNPDRYAVTTLTITRGGIFDSDLQFLQRMYSVRILENAPLNR